MRVKDLDVGKFYRCGDNKCLAVGMRKLFTGDGHTDQPEWLFKHLVIVDNYDKGGIGRCMQEGKNANLGLWEDTRAWTEEDEEEIILNNPNQGLFFSYIAK